MLRILVDTCVWLDLAKDPKQSRNLRIIEELIEGKAVELIVPKTIVDEFRRNKVRVVEDYGRSVGSTLNRAKDIVIQQGNRRRIRSAMKLLNEADYRIPRPKDVATQIFARIEKLLNSSPLLQLSDDVKLRASERAINGNAPFHRGKNSMNDAILIESYHSYVQSHTKSGERFAFVTHNFKDFSHPAANHKLPHPDIAHFFSKIKSRYFISLGDALKTLKSKVTSHWLFEPYDQQARSLDEISEAIDELITKIWYDRHQVSRQKIARGTERIVDKLPDVPWTQRKNLVQRDIWEGALKSAEKVERRFGKENLGPWSKFEWGMINGKVSALRWVLGEDWDELYT
jgi:predicted nucleic acid-binding protein